MLEMRNFRPYQPDEDNAIELETDFNVIFFISEDGRDWYQSQGDFSPDTLKVAYDECGIIRSISRDISKIYPAGFSVAEVADTENNQRADILGGWVYQNGEIFPRKFTAEELSSQAMTEKNTLLKFAETKIAPLARAVRLDMATPEDVLLLDAWERYSILINRVDTSAAPNIAWPVKPE